MTIALMLSCKSGATETKAAWWSIACGARSPANTIDAVATERVAAREDFDTAVERRQKTDRTDRQAVTIGDVEYIRDLLHVCFRMNGAPLGHSHYKNNNNKY